MIRLSFAASFALVLLASCRSNNQIALPAAGTPGIVLKTEQVAEHKYGKVTFPAGLYQPEAVSEIGTYYAAPGKVSTGGVMRGGKEHGGLFIARGSEQQFLWIGQPAYQLMEAPKTVLGQWGVETPLLYSLRSPVSITKAGTSSR
jgi:hypothetical protein